MAFLIANPHQNKSTRPLLRSLLQKAVRRGYADLSQKVAYTLASQGDSAWLHTRIGIIVFEECWPCVHLLNVSKPSVLVLQEVASTFKNKDATGLGSLAYAAAEGDNTAIKYAHDPIAVKIVAAALKRPEAFFKWAIAECSSEEQIKIALAAQHFFSRASWPWDKAFIAASAYLGCRNGAPQTLKCNESPQESFPFWVAVDKHTPQGKTALRRAASALRLPETQLQWASFYFESAKTHALSHSPWWECESRWRFRSLGINIEEAKEMWVQASSHIQLAVKEHANTLRHIVDQKNPEALL